MPTKPSPIDGYLASAPGDRRAALQKLRRTLRTILPKAEECISYGIPALRLHGKVVAGFAATKAGCSYFPFSGSTLDSLASDLEGYGRTRSSLHFTPAGGLPVSLVRKLVRTRRAEIESTGGRVTPRRSDARRQATGAPTGSHGRPPSRPRARSPDRTERR